LFESAYLAASCSLTVLVAGCPGPTDPLGPPMSALVRESTQTRLLARDVYEDLVSNFNGYTLCVPPGYTANHLGQWQILKNGTYLYNNAVRSFTTWVETFERAVEFGESVATGSPAADAFVQAINDARAFLRWARDPSSCVLQVQPQTLTPKPEMGSRDDTDAAGANKVTMAEVALSTGAPAGELAIQALQVLPALVGAADKLVGRYAQASAEERQQLLSAVHNSLERQRWVHVSLPASYQLQVYPIY